MLNQKGSFLIILAVGILSIAITSSAAFYLYQSNKNKPAPQPTESLKSDKALSESVPSTDFPLRQFDVNQKFFESESYPLEITSVKDSALIGMKCTSTNPQTTKDPEILSAIKAAANTFDQTSPITASIEEVTSCKTSDGLQILRYKTAGGGGGAGAKEYFGVKNKDDIFTKVSSINEKLAYFGCNRPLQITKDRVMYYECSGGTQGMGGGKSIYKVNINANSSNLLKKCISVLNESSKTTSVFCNDGEIEKYGQYLVSTNFLGDKQLISIKRLNGQTVTQDLIEQNYDAILNNLGKLGLKGSGMIGYAVGLGSSESAIVLEVNPGDGSKFETDVDLNTGQIIETSFIKK